MPLEGFHLPLSGKLTPENGLVKYSLAISWNEFAIGHYNFMNVTQGRPD